ncbi:Hypothetical predicted protein [Cloeon dipterum]|uniref:Uncharacterized protein n=1 Tax=Cloeon dipterum TaxID=197152 RepID=A0A8S1CP18_9INSE|nr:Hypothetical predicted protein [Cloeon dipterum]
MEKCNSTENPEAPIAEPGIRRNSSSSSDWEMVLPGQDIPSPAASSSSSSAEGDEIFEESQSAVPHSDPIPIPSSSRAEDSLDHLPTPARSTSVHADLAIPSTSEIEQSREEKEDVGAAVDQEPTPSTCRVQVSQDPNVVDDFCEEFDMERLLIESLLQIKAIADSVVLGPGEQINRKLFVPSTCQSENSGESNWMNGRKRRLESMRQPDLHEMFLIPDECDYWREMGGTSSDHYAPGVPSSSQQASEYQTPPHPLAMEEKRKSIRKILFCLTSFPEVEARLRCLLTKMEKCIFCEEPVAEIGMICQDCGQGATAEDPARNSPSLEDWVIVFAELESAAAELDYSTDKNHFHHTEPENPAAASKISEIKQSDGIAQSSAEMPAPTSPVDATVASKENAGLLVYQYQYAPSLIVSLVD